MDTPRNRIPLPKSPPQVIKKTERHPQRMNKLKPRKLVLND